MYSVYTSTILLCMILTGAGRSVGVKLFYQMGYDNPLVVVALYLLGQSLSLLVYAMILTRWFCFPRSRYDLVEDSEENLDDQELSCMGDTVDKGCDDTSNTSRPQHQLKPKLKRQGSDHGLTEESVNAVSWVHSIPWYLKPAIPGVFNLCNALLRWASFIYVPASVAEMLIAGTELILSVVAARLIRKRLVSHHRWIGVGIVSVGILLIGFAHLVHRQGDDQEPAQQQVSRHDHTIGNTLIIGQSIMSVLQDITEEIFLHEADFPATLLLGMEGIFGLIVGSVLFMAARPFLEKDLVGTIGDTTPFAAAFSIGLTLWFTMTGIFNIMSTEATSSMTRNVWKNSRTLLVWVLGLIIYYSTNSTNLGEGWTSPDSYVILCGFLVMLGGIVAYYS